MLLKETVSVPLRDQMLFVRIVLGIYEVFFRTVVLSREEDWRLEVFYSLRKITTLCNIVERNSLRILFLKSKWMVLRNTLPTIWLNLVRLIMI